MTCIKSFQVETSSARSSSARDRKPTSARHDTDVRRQRQEVQRQTRIEEQRVHRKREHSRTRTGTIPYRSPTREKQV